MQREGSVISSTACSAPHSKMTLNERAGPPGHIWPSVNSAALIPVQPFHLPSSTWSCLASLKKQNLYVYCPSFLLMHCPSSEAKPSRSSSTAPSFFFSVVASSLFFDTFAWASVTATELPDVVTACTPAPCASPRPCSSSSPPDSSSSLAYSASPRAPGVESAPSIHLAYSETTFLPSSAATAPPAAPSAAAVTLAPLSLRAVTSLRSESICACCLSTVTLSALTSAWSSPSAAAPLTPPAAAAAVSTASCSIFLAASTAASSTGSSSANFAMWAVHCWRSARAFLLISSFLARPVLSWSKRSARALASRWPSSAQWLAHCAPPLPETRASSSLPSQQSQMPSPTREA
mmetsp:Transcript_19482/g.41508  ORF Transcript_19482/g.41508 Transcript_19482/m.41508 type:complete len:348 (+) Transcript_19482:192-1235(+)